MLVAAVPVTRLACDAVNLCAAVDGRREAGARDVEHRHLRRKQHEAMEVAMRRELRELVSRSTRQ